MLDPPQLPHHEPLQVSGARNSTANKESMPEYDSVHPWIWFASTTPVQNVVYMCLLEVLIMSPVTVLFHFC